MWTIDNIWIITKCQFFPFLFFSCDFCFNLRQKIYWIAKSVGNFRFYNFFSIFFSKHTLWWPVNFSRIQGADFNSWRLLQKECYIYPRKIHCPTQISHGLDYNSGLLCCLRTQILNIFNEGKKITEQQNSVKKINNLRTYGSTKV